MFEFNDFLLAIALILIHSGVSEFRQIRVNKQQLDYADKLSNKNLSDMFGEKETSLDEHFADVPNAQFHRHN